MPERPSSRSRSRTSTRWSATRAASRVGSADGPRRPWRESRSSREDCRGDCRSPWLATYLRFVEAHFRASPATAQPPRRRSSRPRRVTGGRRQSQVAAARWRSATGTPRHARHPRCSTCRSTPRRPRPDGLTWRRRGGGRRGPRRVQHGRASDSPVTVCMKGTSHVPEGTPGVPRGGRSGRGARRRTPTIVRSPLSPRHTTRWRRWSGGACRCRSAGRRGDGPTRWRARSWARGLLRLCVAHSTTIGDRGPFVAAHEAWSSARGTAAAHACW